MKKILIADDNENFCKSLEDILSEKGYDVYFVHNGKEAIKRIYNVSPDIVIMDLAIPGMDGCEVCKAIRNDKFYKNLPIIIVSGRTQEISIPSELNINGIMYKPMDMHEFLNKLENVLSASEATS